MGTLRRYLALLCLLGASLLAASPSSSQEAAPFLVGAAKVSTDPPGQVCLGGYGSFCNRPSLGIKDPAFARAMAVTGSDGGSIVLVTTTAVGLFASYKEEWGPNGIYDIRQRIASRIPVASDHVVITADHSHASPDTIGIWGGVDQSYMDLLASGIEEAAVQAYSARRPARVLTGSTIGPVLSSSYRDRPTTADVIDREFRALIAESPDGERIATLVNYAPHATVCGPCDDLLSGDWPEWAAQEIESTYGGTGLGVVGAMGAADWGKSGSLEEREDEGRDRIRRLLKEATLSAVSVTGSSVAAEVVFITEPLAQPVLLLNYLPPVVDIGEGPVTISRDVRPPWSTGLAIGTYTGALRIGDLFVSLFPGEPFSELQDTLRSTVGGTSAHFLFGAANDFLGYMVGSQDAYIQTLSNGLLFLAGCPEREALRALGLDPDPACPDHWTLMVSPTIGAHLACTIQDAAVRLGFEVSGREESCALLTALDGVSAPSEMQTSGSAAGEQDEPGQGAAEDQPHPENLEDAPSGVVAVASAQTDSNVGGESGSLRTTGTDAMWLGLLGGGLLLAGVGFVWFERRRRR